jgi:tetratricopeptide (TPR) repeat protein
MLEAWVARAPQSAHALFWRGQVWAWLCHPEEALADYARAVELDPKADDARTFLAESLLLENRAREALEHFQRLAERRPESGIVQLGLARCWHELGDLEQCRRLLDGRLAADPHDGQALLQRGKLALVSNLPAAAEGWLRQALRVLPHEDQGHYLLGLCLERQGKKAEAKRSFAEADRIHADVQRLSDIFRGMTTELTDPARRCEVASLLLRIGRVQEGLGWLHMLLQEQPGYGPAHQVLADYYERAGDATRAARHLRLAAEGARTQAAVPGARI